MKHSQLQQFGTYRIVHNHPLYPNRLIILQSTQLRKEGTSGPHLLAYLIGTGSIIRITPEDLIP